MSDEKISKEEMSALMEELEEKNVSNEDNDKNDTPDGLNTVLDQQAEPLMNDMEMDILGEVGNISMGNAATTLFALLGEKVSITTPSVRLTSIRALMESYELPFVFVVVEYSLGIEGVNLLILKQEDVKIMTSLMMGGNGIDNLPDELDDIHLSAISEAMNQMIGTSSTSLSEMLDEKIDISPPKISMVDMNHDDISEKLDIDAPVACTSFRMTIGELVDSSIMQVLPMEFANRLVYKMSYKGSEPSEAETIQEVVQQPEFQEMPEEFNAQDEINDRDMNFVEMGNDFESNNNTIMDDSVAPDNLISGDEIPDQYKQSMQTIPDVKEETYENEIIQSSSTNMENQGITNNNLNEQNFGRNQFTNPVRESGGDRRMSNNQQESQTVKVKPARFSEFDAPEFNSNQVPENIDIIKDVMLQITVELGKTVKPINDILDFQPGSIIELDKLVGESLDILANGRRIAMGEVVVIDENYGIRITDIVKPDRRNS